MIRTSPKKREIEQLAKIQQKEWILDLSSNRNFKNPIPRGSKRFQQCAERLGIVKPLKKLNTCYIGLAVDNQTKMK